MIFSGLGRNSILNIGQNAGIWLLFVITFCGRFWSGRAEEKMEVSTLVAETVNYFIEKLQGEQSNLIIKQDGSDFPQTRGGGYGGGHGHGGHGHGAITLDPVSIISLLALGAFLINNILQLLRANMNNNQMPNPNPMMGRKFTEFTLENLSRFSADLNGLDQHSSDNDEPGFANFFKNVGSLYYLQPKKRHMCMKRVVCNYLNMKETREKGPNDLKAKIFDFMLSTVTKIVAPEMDEHGKEEKCLKTHKFCSDSLLKDAQVSVEYKIYSQVSTWLTKLAFNGLTSG